MYLVKLSFLAACLGGAALAALQDKSTINHSFQRPAGVQVAGKTIDSEDVDSDAAELTLLSSAAVARGYGGDDAPSPSLQTVRVYAGRAAGDGRARTILRGQLPATADVFITNSVHAAASAEEMESMESARKLQEAVEVLKSSSEEAARTSATQAIQQELEAQFKRDLARREKELAEVEARLQNLRTQLEKRKTAQADIVALKLKTIMNAADGLGFPGESDERQVMGFEVMEGLFRHQAHSMDDLEELPEPPEPAVAPLPPAAPAREPGLPLEQGR